MWLFYQLILYDTLTVTADIDKVLNTELKLSKDKPPLFIERCDLAKVLRPYLVVRGLEDWIEEYVEEHFKEIAKGAAIEFVKIKDNAAEIMFVNPQGNYSRTSYNQEHLRQLDLSLIQKYP